MSPQKLASEVVRAFPRNERGSVQNVWRMFVFDYVEAAFGSRGPEHGLPKDLNVILDGALGHLRLTLGVPDFVPQTA